MKEEEFDIEEIAKMESDSGFDYFRFTFADFHGIARSQSFPKRHLAKYIKNGMALFGGLMAIGPRTELTVVDEVDELHIPNCNYRPCRGTFHELPWAAVSSDKKEQSFESRFRVGEVFCESFWIKPYRNGAPQEACARYVARKQLNRLKNLGYYLKSSFEAEFILYDNKTMEPVFKGMDAATALRLSKFEEYLYDMERKLKRSGVDVVSMIVEHGEGQFEFGMEPVDGIGAADAMFIIKQGVKEMSQQRGWIATFMARPFINSTTNGLHLNHSIWSSGEPNKNEFHDSTKADGLSDLHRHWIAGLLKHSKSMTALCCPTVNCYRRLHCFLAPDTIEWGLDDRLATYRAKSISHSATYVENRLPSGACNPYIALACTIAAGIDGIINHLECPPPRQEGFKHLIPCLESQFPRQEDTAEKSYVPYSLEEALDCLEKDDVMKEALGEEFIRWYLQEKRDNEVNVVKALDPESRFSKERELYFEFL